MAETNNPLALPSDFDSEQNGLNFAIQQAMLKLQTSLPVRVMAVRNAGLAPVGHRIRVQITSSNFPRYDRNLNTGGPNFSEAAAAVAVNTIYHSARYPSRIRLSLAPAN